MKKLPKSIGTFSTLIENDYLYVDKTEYIFKLIEPGQKFFLSRPRRFGKSLLVSTLKELFSANKKLFKDLYIYDKWDWTKSYPVIHLDFSVISYTNPDVLKESLNLFLENKAKEFNLRLNKNNLIKDKFGKIIEEIYLKTNEKVVILIDEYDKAIIDHIEDVELAKEIRAELNSFYGALKHDEYIEFVFITGVTKFAKTSIFSGLNNLTDLTLSSPLICGYSQSELEIYFDDRISDFAFDENISKEYLLDLIKQWYNGYSYNGKDFLYNPYSILSLFDKKRFSNFWFETGTPTFLMKLIGSGKLDLSVLLNPKQTITDNIPNFDLENLDFTTILLQTGYLTIKKEEYTIGSPSIFTLDIPNKEVYDSLYTNILSYYTKKSVSSIPSLMDTILDAISKADNERLQKSFEILFSSIPNSLFNKVKEDIREANFHMMILSWMKIIGLEIIGEVQSSKGTVDAILKKDNLIVVIEIKYSLKSSLKYMIEKALKQIKEKEYYKPYLDKNVLLLAIAIKDRDLCCKIETLKNGI
ncbi:ATP-binding protein [Methanobrevibacter filiformis]|uniref:Putative AAA-ATPase n=1 Tax=Methanobrevibacter filiformis TaxID=55758 RepID=A0A166AAT5_9EURY|nr:ATP-binding protein [Methanobrevibacter filiformis]KZX11798.1 putative AAA-ATPase [Methanobrevibacter filiformis]